MEEKETLQETSTVPEFKNEEVYVKVHRKPSCRVELEVEASPSIVKKAQDKAARIVGKEVVIPGFRKGKAPEALVLKNHFKDVDKKWQECIAEETFIASQKLAQIPVLNRDPKISFNMKRHSLEEGAYLILFFETEPAIPSIKPTELELKAIDRPAVDEEKISETIRQLQFFFAEWKHISDRPVQENDFVILDVDVIEEEPPQSLFSKVRFEVKDRTMAAWMKELVLGRHKGESMEGISTPDADASTQDKETLKPKKVRVTIHEVQEATLPELNDELAKKMGSPSLQEMRNSVEKLLTKQSDDHVKEKMREQLTNVLLTKYAFDIPISLVDRETRFRMQQLLQDAEFQKHWEKMTTEARKKTVASIAEQSEKAVRMFYLCRKVVSDAGIQISPQDLPPAPEKPLDALVGPNRNAHAQEKNEIHQAEAYSRLLLEKAEDFLISQATVA